MKALAYPQCPKTVPTFQSLEYSVVSTVVLFSIYLGDTYIVFNIQYHFSRILFISEFTEF